jgi:hypothetical protein
VRPNNPKIAPNPQKTGGPIIVGGPIIAGGRTQFAPTKSTGLWAGKKREKGLQSPPSTAHHGKVRQGEIILIDFP